MKIQILVVIIIFSSFSFGQISQTVVNKENFEKSGFPFKGKRVLMVENILTPSEENYYVFSKNERGSEQDSLYIQQFKKINGEWKITAETFVAEKGIITSTWDSRKSFFDADKDGQADVLFVYSKHPKDNLDKQLDVVLLFIYKNKFYTIGNAGENNYNPDFDYYEAGFEDLPQSVQDAVETYWINLDKQ